MEKADSPVTAAIDAIEARVYATLKKFGFRRHGRTLHRFVSGDISQVINFQCGQAYRGETDSMWVNTGIRVPECSEREFFPSLPAKKYYLFSQRNPPGRFPFLSLPPLTPPFPGHYNRSAATEAAPAPHVPRK